MMPNRAVHELDEGRRFYAGRIAGLDTGHFGPMWHLITIAHLTLANLEKIADVQGLSIADLFLLGTVRMERDVPLRPTDLADKLFTSSAVLGGRIDRLAGLGLIVRQPCREDRRASRVRITAKGARLVEEAILRISRDSAFVRSLRRVDESDRAALERILGALHGEMLRFGPGA